MARPQSSGERGPGGPGRKRRPEVSLGERLVFLEHSQLPKEAFDIYKISPAKQELYGTMQGYTSFNKKRLNLAERYYKYAQIELQKGRVPERDLSKISFIGKSYTEYINTRDWFVNKIYEVQSITNLEEQQKIKDSFLEDIGVIQQLANIPLQGNIVTSLDLKPVKEGGQAGGIIVRDENEATPEELMGTATPIVMPTAENSGANAAGENVVVAPAEGGGEDAVTPASEDAQVAATAVANPADTPEVAGATPAAAVENPAESAAAAAPPTPPTERTPRAPEAGPREEVEDMMAHAKEIAPYLLRKYEEAKIAYNQDSRFLPPPGNAKEARQNEMLRDALFQNFTEARNDLMYALTQASRSGAGFTRTKEGQERARAKLGERFFKNEEIHEDLAFDPVAGILREDVLVEGFSPYLLENRESFSDSLGLKALERMVDPGVRQFDGVLSESELERLTHARIKFFTEQAAHFAKGNTREKNLSVARSEYRKLLNAAFIRIGLPPGGEDDSYRGPQLRAFVREQDQELMQMLFELSLSPERRRYMPPLAQAIAQESERPEFMSFFKAAYQRIRNGIRGERSRPTEEESVATPERGPRAFTSVSIAPLDHGGVATLEELIAKVIDTDDHSAAARVMQQLFQRNRIDPHSTDRADKLARAFGLVEVSPQGGVSAWYDFGRRARFRLDSGGLWIEYLAGTLAGRQAGLIDQLCRQDGAILDNSRDFGRRMIRPRPEA